MKIKEKKKDENVKIFLVTMQRNNKNETLHCCKMRYERFVRVIYKIFRT